MVASAGIGQVAGKTGDFSLSELKPAFGIGLRFPLIAAQNVNLRIDLGLGKNDSSFDINIMEAF